ncbi:hypothetical protein CB1_001504001 [Camelus ferus]|nr:hypothetical protein CB1_001504001 [Camelus ferus]
MRAWEPHLAVMPRFPWRERTHLLTVFLLPPGGESPLCASPPGTGLLAPPEDSPRPTWNSDKGMGKALCPGFCVGGTVPRLRNRTLCQMEGPWQVALSLTRVPALHAGPPAPVCLQLLVLEPRARAPSLATCPGPAAGPATWSPTMEDSHELDLTYIIEPAALPGAPCPLHTPCPSLLRPLRRGPSHDGKYSDCGQEPCRPATWSPTMEDSHELDLTYIIEHIIAMSFPAGCSEESYLHNLQEVTCMLRSKDGDNYLLGGH